MIWEVLAIRYATLARPAQACFTAPEGIADVEMGLDYYVWLLRSGERTILVDTGYGKAVAERRNRPRQIDPVEALARLGVAAGSVSDVVITHLHYDHAGNLADWPAARFHIQAAETAYASGPRMADAHERMFFEVDDIAGMVGLLHHDRVTCHEGDAEIAPGVSVHLVPGHTAGTQCVRVATARGQVVLASDATHYYGNFLMRNPFPGEWDRSAVLASYDRLTELADSTDHVIPGHDPQVLKLYPPLPASGGVAAVCLHLPPASRPDLAPILLPEISQ